MVGRKSGTRPIVLACACRCGMAVFSLVGVRLLLPSSIDSQCILHIAEHCRRPSLSNLNTFAALDMVVVVDFADHMRFSALLGPLSLSPRRIHHPNGSRLATYTQTTQNLQADPDSFRDSSFYLYQSSHLGCTIDPRCSLVSNVLALILSDPELSLAFINIVEIDLEHWNLGISTCSLPSQLFLSFIPLPSTLQT